MCGVFVDQAVVVLLVVVVLVIGFDVPLDTQFISDNLPSQSLDWCKNQFSQ